MTMQVDDYADASADVTARCILHTTQDTVATI